MTSARTSRVGHTALFLGLLVLGAGHHTLSKECLPPALVIAEGARSVKYAQLSEATYVVDEPYPAEKLLAELTTKLNAQGWRPLSRDPLNPEITNAPTHRWSHFLDGTNGPTDVDVDQWMGWFEDQLGNRLLLALRYRGRQSASGASAVTVYISHEEKAIGGPGEERP
ncbi:MAG TPA: hypothetical protein VF128_02920 [Gemmatimonadaceae bacterium]